MASTERKSLALYCFPCAGGSAASYLHWRRHLPSWICLRPVELAGRGGRMKDEFIRDFDFMVERLTEDLARDPLTSYAFFGHSLGALLAYDCAHTLRERGRLAPLAIVAACCSAPSRRDDARLPRLKRNDELIDEMRSLGGTPSDLFHDEELLQMTLDTLAADFALCSSFVYRDRTPLTADIFVLGGREDRIDEEGLAAWRAETTGRTVITMFEGGHFFFKGQEDRLLEHLARQLKDVIRIP